MAHRSRSSQCRLNPDAVSLLRSTAQARPCTSLVTALVRRLLSSLLCSDVSHALSRDGLLRSCQVSACIVLPCRHMFIPLLPFVASLGNKLDTSRHPRLRWERLSSSTGHYTSGDVTAFSRACPSRQLQQATVLPAATGSTSTHAHITWQVPHFSYLHSYLTCACDRPKRCSTRVWSSLTRTSARCVSHSDA